LNTVTLPDDVVSCVGFDQNLKELFGISINLKSHNYDVVQVLFDKNSTEWLYDFDDNTQVAIGSSYFRSSAHVFYVTILDNSAEHPQIVGYDVSKNVTTNYPFQSIPWGIEMNQAETIFYAFVLNLNLKNPSNQLVQYDLASKASKVLVTYDSKVPGNFGATAYDPKGNCLYAVMQDLAGEAFFVTTFLSNNTFTEKFIPFVAPMAFWVV